MYAACKTTQTMIEYGEITPYYRDHKLVCYTHIGIGLVTIVRGDIYWRNNTRRTRLHVADEVK